MRVNFRAAQQDFEALPNGSYSVDVESMEMKMSTTNNPMIATQYTVKDSRDDIKGRKLFDNFSLLPSAGWKLKNFLEASSVPHVAIPGANKGEFEIEFDTNDAIGAMLVVQTEQETFEKKQGGKAVFDENGQKVMGIRNKITGYLKA